ncbi:MAG: hypothetical protein Q9219_004089 [cf. Caloplaca sp. 3 TL-2023]
MPIHDKAPLPEQRERKHLDGVQVTGKDADGNFIVNVTVVEGRYDKEKGKWMYDVQDVEGKRDGVEDAHSVPTIDIHITVLSAR